MNGGSPAAIRCPAIRVISTPRHRTGRTARKRTSDQTRPIEVGAACRASGNEVLMRNINDRQGHGAVFSEFPNVTIKRSVVSIVFACRATGQDLRSVLDTAREGESLVGLEVVGENLGSRQRSSPTATCTTENSLLFCHTR